MEFFIVNCLFMENKFFEFLKLVIEDKSLVKKNIENIIIFVNYGIFFIISLIKIL